VGSNSPVSVFDQFYVWLQDPTREGRSSNDPNDPGGLTRFGISQAANPDIDVASLTDETAKQLYRDRYWATVAGDQLPPALAVIVADAAVNQGVRTAIKILQRSLGVQDDGIIGPQTIGAAKLRTDRPFIAHLIAHRSFDYGQDAQFKHFGLGWCQRTADCHQFALTVG
jgi:lysozyme family protein